MRRYLAELIGTAVLAGKDVGNLGVAVAFGLTLLTMVYAIGPISGCHINPAVTVGLLAVGRITARDAIGYIVAQLLGAIAAAAGLFVIAKSKTGGYDAGTQGFGANGVGARSPQGYHVGGVIVTEVILTALLVFVVLACTNRFAQVQFAGVPIGLTLLLIHLISIPVDNTGVNPARSLAPALFVGHAALSQVWLFLLCPLAGGVIGALVHRAMFPDTSRAATDLAVADSSSSRTIPRSAGQNL